MQAYTWNKIPSATKFRIVSIAGTKSVTSNEISFSLKDCTPVPPPPEPRPSGCPADNISKVTTYSGHYANAVDVFGPDGGPVKARMPGALTFNSLDPRTAASPGTGYGYYAIVENDSYKTLYAHMRSTNLRARGTSVLPGDKLGEQDTSGRATGSHVHYEVYVRESGSWIAHYPGEFGCAVTTSGTAGE